LGENDNRKATGLDERLVLVVRGDLLKRYPNAVIYAVDARRQGDELLPQLPEFGGPSYPWLDYPISPGSLGADLVFFGFPFDKNNARITVDTGSNSAQTICFMVLGPLR
jgi:hypothetical protein